MKKLLVIVAAVMVLGVTAAALAGGWLLGRGGGTPPLAEAPRITTPRITGFVEYVVRDAQGNVKYRSARHNTKLTLLLSDTRDRLGIDGTLAPLTDADLYDNIQLCSDNTSGAGCTLSTSLDANPADGTNTVVGGDGDSGNYQTVKTFTATGASAIEEMQLTKGAAANGVADTGRGAWQNVSITLANTDTLQVTWTIDID